MGTAAFGSVIITICQVIQALLNTAERKEEGQRDACEATVMACLSCCCQFILQFVEYVSRNAYIMCAAHATDFLTSAKMAFNLIMRNIVKVLVITRVRTAELFEKNF